MTPSFPLAANPVLYAFETSDPVGQGIVSLLLLLAVYVWVLLAEKIALVRRVRAETAAFAERFQAAASPLELLLQADRLTGPLAAIYRAGTDTLFELLKLDRSDLEFCCRQHTLPRALTAAELERVRVAMERVRAEQVAALESHLPMLEVMVNVGPLLGLLGTVWGVMLALCALVAVSHAEISALAPGVAGALLSTVVALLLAIPAKVVQRVLAADVAQTAAPLAAFIPNLLVRLRLASPEK